ncbi:ABC transporter permease [Paenibacillus sp. HJGM_3]|uniref:ABC transporter permease n=1 Tax=Paenibacillus sp. HJGM_3 TaxID=3379816 RepID=UPI00385A8458
MRIPARLSTWMVFVGLALLLAGSGLSAAFADQWELANGAVGLRKVAATVDLAADPSASAGLTAEDMEELDRRWSAGRTSYMARTPAMVTTAGGRTANADLLGVSAGYAAFHRLQAQPGSWIGATPVKEASRVAVVSGALADALFGSREVVGLTVSLLGEPFRIIGVAVSPDDGSLLASMTDNGTPDMYIPVTTLLELAPRVKVGAIELEMGDGAIVNGVAEARTALAAIGQPSSRYAFVNYAREQRWTAQKPALVRLVLGAAAALLAARLAVRAARRLAARTAAGLRRLDAADLLRADGAALARLALAAAACAAVASFAVVCARYGFYIPPESLPDELIDVSFYVDRLREAWQAQAAGMGYVPSPPEWLWQRTDSLVTGLSTAGLLLGLPLAGLGLREWALLRMPASAQATRLCLALTAGVGLNAAAAWAAGAGAVYAVRPGELFLLAAASVMWSISRHARQFQSFYEQGVEYR